MPSIGSAISQGASALPSSSHVTPGKTDQTTKDDTQKLVSALAENPPNKSKIHDLKEKLVKDMKDGNDIENPQIKQMVMSQKLLDQLHIPT